MLLLHLLLFSFHIAHFPFSDISIFLFCSTFVARLWNTIWPAYIVMKCTVLYSLRMGLILGLMIFFYLIVLVVRCSLHKYHSRFQTKVNCWDNQVAHQLMLSLRNFLLNSQLRHFSCLPGNYILFPLKICVHSINLLCSNTQCTGPCTCLAHHIAGF